MDTATKIHHSNVTIYAAGNGATPVGTEITGDDRTAILNKYRANGTMLGAFLVDPANYNADEDLSALGPEAGEIDWTGFAEAQRPRDEKIVRSAKAIGATQIEDGRWAYRDDATRCYYLVSDDDLVSLHDDYTYSPREEVRADAYSHWCAGSIATEVTKDSAEYAEIIGPDAADAEMIELARDRLAHPFAGEDVEGGIRFEYRGEVFFAGWKQLAKLGRCIVREGADRSAEAFEFWMETTTLA